MGTTIYTVGYRDQSDVRKIPINKPRCEQCEGGNTLLINTMRAYVRAFWPYELHLHAYARACARTYACVCMCACVRVRACLCAYVCACSTCERALCTCVRVYGCVLTCVHALCTCACVRMCVCVCVCVRERTCVHARRCVCMCVRIQVRARACTCEGNEGALPLGPSSPIEGQPPKLFVHLGGLDRSFGRLSQPVPVHASN